MKKTYTPGTFIEIDDLYGNRKISMVAKDGITFWDAVSVDSVTPIIIHPVFNPVELGSLMDFVQKHKAEAVLAAVAAFFKRKLDDSLESDPIYLMRIIWAFVSIKNPPYESDVSDSNIEDAIAMAQEQNRNVMELHEFTVQFVNKEWGAA